MIGVADNSCQPMYISRHPLRMYVKRQANSRQIGHESMPLAFSAGYMPAAITRHIALFQTFKNSVLNLLRDVYMCSFML